MKPLDFTCTHFDTRTNFLCGALPGELCMYPDGFGGRAGSDQCHPERLELARSINDGKGQTPTVVEFDRAVEVAIGETL